MIKNYEISAIKRADYFIKYRWVNEKTWANKYQLKIHLIPFKNKVKEGFIKLHQANKFVEAATEETNGALCTH